MVDLERKEDNRLLFINRQWTKEEEEFYGKFLKTPKKGKKSVAGNENPSPLPKKKVAPAY